MGPRVLAFAGLLAAAGFPAVAHAQAGSEVDFILRGTSSPALADVTGAIGEPEPVLDNVGNSSLPGVDDPLGPALAGPVADEEPARRPRRPLPGRMEDEEDPFAPVGVSLSTFLIRPSIEIGVSATDNAALTPRKKAAVGLLVAPDIEITSDWSRHALEARLRGSAIYYGDEEIDEREGSAEVRGRYDVSSRTNLNAALGYRTDLDRYTDPETPAGAVERPARHLLYGEAGATHRFNRLSVTATGRVERSIYDDVAVAGGGTVSRSDLDNTDYGLRLRGAYEMAVISPFVEVAGGATHYDEAGAPGTRRSTPWGELRGGIMVDLGPKLEGEVSLGYRREQARDPAVKDLDALIAAAALMWSPRRLTEVRLDLSTDTRPTSLPGSAGSVVYAGTLTLSRRLREALSAEAGVGVDYERFAGISRDQIGYRGFLGFTYNFSRGLALVGRYEYERVDGSDPAADAEANTVSLRLRLRR
ncbi:outer membrane beta-barrel protein [Faunimonas sp. B44]|uniref:outer membrane beta-barrel protein n=1 Tax=Faunimonas sp. B44 TaxID=3461493 RepID=UPI0040444449